MDQVKIGNFIKTLRKESGLTQEQLAERFNVSRRTVSRWETGSNLPDIDILIELSDYYKVELRELLDGERKDEKMEKELEETVLKVADYSNERKKKIMRRMHVLFIGGLIAAILYSILWFTGKEDNFLGGMCLGITVGMPVIGILVTSRSLEKVSEAKMRLLHRHRK